MTLNKFSHGLDLASMILSSDLPHKACTAICSTPINDHDPPFSISIKEFSLPDNGKIIAFRSSPKCTVQILEEHGKDLVPTNGTFFEFIATKVNPCISKAAAQVFASLYTNQLSVLQDLIDISKPLLVTGNSLAGSVASLFTLWLLDSIYTKTSKRPTCITFGSPLLGDIHFQKAIHQRSSWPNCFLHVVLSRDPIPKLFVSPTYKPFGLFFFCSELGSACFDQPESVSEVMVAMNSQSIRSCNIYINDYKSVLDEQKSKVICRGKSELGDYKCDSLRVGVVLQLEAIGLIQTQQQQQEWSNDIENLIKKLVKGFEHDLKRKKDAVDPKRMLNKIKKSMTYLEWYKKVEEKDRGYYDGFKMPGGTEQKRSKAEIDKHKAILNNYWEKEVQKADHYPQKKDVPLNTSSLYAGTNYRRMVEPLDIADYYKHGKTNYINSGRSEHYKLLEKWFNNAHIPSQTSNGNERKKASLTEDSCFWAHVEEALISLNVLKSTNNIQEHKDLAMHKLIKFEGYVMGLIENCSVSTEIFLEKSTYMKWWKEYELYNGAQYNSLLSNFMKNNLPSYTSL